MRSTSRTGARQLRVALIALIALVALITSLLLVPTASSASTGSTSSTDSTGNDPLESTRVDLVVTLEPAGVASALRLSLRTAADEPVAEAALVLERRTNGRWRVIDQPVTDADGGAVVERVLFRDADDNHFRASYDGDEAHAGSTSETVVAELVRRAGVVVLTGPDAVVDGRRAVLRLRWRTRSGEAVRGRVRVMSREAGGSWLQAATVRTDGQGRARLRVRPRVDTRWRALAPGLDWVSADRSTVLRIDNLPPRTPVRLPSSAPAPRVALPPQPRGSGRGAHPVVTAIPDKVWDSMVGRSWHEGCPVGRADLRLLRVNYWGFDGYRHRGEVVASSAAVGAMARALSGLYAARLPIRSMYRVDRFGWSARLRGADDFRSMAADNTSAFNCRDVVNRPGVRSPHSYGRSLDVNPWENPYRSARGLVPNSWWHPRSHPQVAWRSGSHRVVRTMARAGLRWTYGTGDSHHFDAIGHGGHGSHGRVVPPYCGRVACH